MTPQITLSVPSSRRHAQPDFFAWFCSASLAALVVGLFRWHWPETDSSGSSQPVQVARQFLQLRDGRLHRAGTSAPFTGRVAEFRANGQLQSRSEVIEGRLHGVSEGWHTNGVLQVRERFVAGVSHGLRTKWHANGGLQSAVEIAEGKLDGTFRRWSEDGTLAEQMELKADVPDGTASGYYPSGRLRTRVRLQNGKAVEQTTWPDGEEQGPGVTAMLK